MVRSVTVRIDGEDVELSVGDDYFYLVLAIERLTKELAKMRQ